MCAIQSGILWFSKYLKKFSKIRFLSKSLDSLEHPESKYLFNRCNTFNFYLPEGRFGGFYMLPVLIKYRFVSVWEHGWRKKTSFVYPVQNFLAASTSSTSTTASLSAAWATSTKPLTATRRTSGTASRASSSTRSTWWPGRRNRAVLGARPRWQSYWGF